MAIIVNKPWGYEYIAFQTHAVAVKVLHIRGFERTSLHCHPNKSTGLVVVGGQAMINFIADQTILNAPAKKMIRRGLFHQTVAIDEEGVIMLEIETPIDQNDLVRMNDNYGRNNKGYEPSSFVDERDCLEIATTRGKVNSYKLGTSNIRSGFIEDFDLSKLSDAAIIMMLNGGLIKTVDARVHVVIKPGDVGHMSVVKKVIPCMDTFLPNTTIMVIE
jgi:hypothetical protein